MIQRVIKVATVNLRQFAKWAGVSYETARSWRMGRRGPRPAAKRKLATALRTHALRILKLAARLEGSADREDKKGGTS